MALLISNQDAEQVLTMRGCLESIEAGVKEYYENDATCRPRIDVWAPSGNPNGYYQWGSMEGTSRGFGVFADVRLGSDAGARLFQPHGAPVIEAAAAETAALR